MRTKKILLSSFLTLLWLVSACNSNSNQFQLKTNCTLPCWNQLIPGKSTKEEVLIILSNLQVIDSKSIIISGPVLGIFDESIEFQIKSQPGIGSIKIKGKAMFQSNQLSALHFYNTDIGITFGDVTELIDLPNEVITIGSRNGTPMVRLIKTSKGVSFGNSMGHEINISPETSIDFLLLFPPDKYETILQSRILVDGFYDVTETKKITYPWKGYGNLDELYPMQLP